MPLVIFQTAAVPLDARTQCTPSTATSELDHEANAVETASVSPILVIFWRYTVVRNDIWLGEAHQVPLQVEKLLTKCG